MQQEENETEELGPWRVTFMAESAARNKLLLLTVNARDTVSSTRSTGTFFTAVDGSLHQTTRSTSFT